MKRSRYCLIHYTKRTIQKDVLIQPILQIVSGVQNHGGLSDVDRSRASNKKRYEHVIKPIQNEDVVPFVVPFSKMSNIAARIIKKKNIVKFSNKKKR